VDTYRTQACPPLKGSECGVGSVSESNCEGIEAQEFSAGATDSPPAGTRMNAGFLQAD